MCSLNISAVLFPCSGALALPALNPVSVSHHGHRSTAAVWPQQQSDHSAQVSAPVTLNYLVTQWPFCKRNYTSTTTVKSYSKLKRAIGLTENTASLLHYCIFLALLLTGRLNLGARHAGCGVDG